MKALIFSGLILVTQTSVAMAAQDQGRVCDSSKSVLCNQSRVFEGTDNHVYLLFSNGKPWHLASADCRSIGGYLVSVGSEEENSLLTSVLNTLTIPELWLGTTDEVQEGVWTWESGEAYSFEVWHAEEPNNFASFENAAVLYRTGFWNDVPGDLRLPYVCERDLN